MLPFDCAAIISGRDRRLGKRGIDKVDRDQDVLVHGTVFPGAGLLLLKSSNTAPTFWG